MRISRIYGHTDDLDMMLFITVGLWFGFVAWHVAAWHVAVCVAMFLVNA